MAERSIVPKTHILKSIRHRTGQSLDGALHEFCDNAIGHGQANTVYITITRDQIVVRDDGLGADDIVRLFTLGDASSYGKLNEIGQYGIGATDSAIFLGNGLEVVTVRNGRVHRGVIDWEAVEENGEWTMQDERDPFAPSELATDFPTAQGTKVTISKLHRRWATASSARLAEHLGLVFMPALRAGTRLHVTHMDKSGVKLREWIAPYDAPPLRDEIVIAGSFETGKGSRVSWTGKAGLSSELTSKENAVLIIFEHRVIERTDDPFQGKSAPTLYAEIELSGEDRAKYLLSDKKDRIVRYRDELVDSIHQALVVLIEKARGESQHLALANISIPIQEKLTKALQGSGLVFVDPDEEGESGEGRGPVAPQKGRLKPIRPEGVPAKERPPTGVQIEWKTLEQLNRMPYDTTFSAYSVTVKLAREYYDGIIDWPPKQRDQRIVELIVGFVARGIEVAVENGDQSVLRALRPKLQRRVEEWAIVHEVAPRLQAELQARLARAEAKA